MNAVSEVIKDLFYYLAGNYEDSLVTNVGEDGRKKMARLLGCSMVEIDICITKLKVDKRIVIKQNFVVEVL